MTEVLRRLDELDVRPNEGLGQHFLIDEEALQFIADQAGYGANVIEIGAGIGNLTEYLAKRANRVLGLEIDRRFQPALEQVEENNQNVSVIYTDALKFDYSALFCKHPRKKGETDEEEWYLIANLPYHIIEPFLKVISNKPFTDIILTVGEKAADALTTRSPLSLGFTKTSLIAIAFFDVEKIAELNKQLFYPLPRTNSTVLRLTPLFHTGKTKNTASHIFRVLLLKENIMTVRQTLSIALESLITKPSKG